MSDSAESIAALTRARAALDGNAEEGTSVSEKTRCGTCDQYVPCPCHEKQAPPPPAPSARAEVAEVAALKADVERLTSDLSRAEQERDAARAERDGWKAVRDDLDRDWRKEANRADAAEAETRRLAGRLATLEAAEAEIKRLKRERLDMLCDQAMEECWCEDAENKHGWGPHFDSFAMSSRAAILDELAEAGLLEVKSEFGRRVIAVWVGGSRDAAFAAAERGGREGEEGK